LRGSDTELHRTIEGHAAAGGEIQTKRVPTLRQITVCGRILHERGPEGIAWRDQAAARFEKTLAGISPEVLAEQGKTPRISETGALRKCDALGADAGLDSLHETVPQ
jgi:hypothetical protein